MDTEYIHNIDHIKGHISNLSSEEKLAYLLEVRKDLNSSEIDISLLLSFSDISPDYLIKLEKLIELTKLEIKDNRIKDEFITPPKEHEASERPISRKKSNRVPWKEDTTLLVYAIKGIFKCGNVPKNFNVNKFIADNFTGKKGQELNAKDLSVIPHNYKINKNDVPKNAFKFEREFKILD